MQPFFKIPLQVSQSSSQDILDAFHVEEGLYLSNVLLQQAISDTL